MGIEYETLAAANKYTEDTIIGQGAIKGDKGDPGPKGDPGEGVAAGGTTGQVLIKSSDADYETEWGTVEGIVREKVYTPVDITLNDGFVRITNGTINTSSGKYFEIPVVSGEKYSITSQHSYYIAVYALYNSNGDFAGAYPTTVIENNIMDAVEVTIPEGVTMMRGSGYSNSPIKVYKVTDGDYSVNNKANDVLYGKKWVVCGDSFTAGALSGYTDSEGHTGYESDGFDPIQGKIKTYSYFIANRTGVNVNMLALGGSDFTNVEGASAPFSNESSAPNYTQIPSDADYITLAYGLNETDLTTEQIGTKTDTTNETLWGAYNVVLTSILTANPSVKIGIIINDAWMTQTYHDALVGIAKYWGIPYLDLKNGVEIPMGINGRLDECSETAKTLRNSAFKIAATAHPTPNAHKYRSTVIENFLRSL